MRPDWDEYFLNIAKVVASRATCIRRGYGTVIVKDNIIVSTGYCGSPKGEPNCIDIGKCEREKQGVPSGERYDLCKSVHAEQNAMIMASPDKMKDAKIYVAGIETKSKSTVLSKPCLMCRRMILNSGIREIIYLTKDNAILKEII